MVKVKCIVDYNDLELGRLVTTKDAPFLVTKDRAKVLADKGLVKVIEVIPEEAKKTSAKKQNKKK